MKDKDLYKAVFSQLHTSVPVSWEEQISMKKQTRRLRVLAAVAVAAAVLCAMTATAFALDLFGLRSMAFPEKTPIRIPHVDVSTGDISYEDKEVDLITIQGYADTPESKACVEWETFYQPYVNAHVFDNSIYDEGGRYSEYPVYDGVMAAKLDEIAEKYGLELHRNMQDVMGRDGWLELFGPTFLSDRNTGYWGYRYEDGTCHFDGDAELEVYGLIDYQFAYSRKGYLDTVTLNVNDLSQYTDWEYTARCGARLNLAIGPIRSFIWADLPEGFVFVNVLTGYEGDDCFSSGPITSAELEELADMFDFNALS